MKATLTDQKLGNLATSLYTIVNVADLTQASVRHVRRLDARRVIPGRITIGRLVRFHRQLVDEWIAAGCPIPPKSAGVSNGG